jgi:hypothetical protein
MMKESRASVIMGQLIYTNIAHSKKNSLDLRDEAVKMALKSGVR